MKFFLFVPLIILGIFLVYRNDGWVVALLFALSGVIFYLGIIFEVLLRISEQIEKKLK